MDYVKNGLEIRTSDQSAAASLRLLYGKVTLEAPESLPSISAGAEVIAEVMREERERAHEMEKALRYLSMALGNPALEAGEDSSIEMELVKVACGKFREGESVRR